MLIRFSFCTKLFFFIFILFNASAHSAEQNVSPTCPLKVYVSGKWQNADPKIFAGENVSTYKNPKAPKFLYFKSEGKVYVGALSCFTTPEKSELPQSATTAQNTTASKSDELHPWSIYFGLGTTISPKTNHNISLKGTANTISPYDESDNGSLGFEVEGAYQLISFFGLGILIDQNSYQYSDASPSDSHLAVLVMPKVGLGSTVRAWAGLGVGLMSSSIKGGTSTLNGLTASNSDQTTMGFDLSPRIGLTYKATEKILLELVGSYTTFSGTVNGTLSNGTNTYSLVDSFSRHWMGVMFRTGVEF